MKDTNTLEAQHARLTAAHIPSDVDPGTRVEGVASDELHTIAAKSDLDRMLHALRPRRSTSCSQGRRATSPTRSPRRCSARCGQSHGCTPRRSHPTSARSPTAHAPRHPS